MKLKAIGAIINKSKQLVLFDEGLRQWIGDGGGVYLMPESVGKLTEQSAPIIFDINETKAADMLIRRNTISTNYDTADEGDEYSTTFDPNRRIKYGGADLLPVTTGGGRTYFLQTKYLKPLTDSDPVITLRYGRNNGMPYFVAKAGMFAEAILMPWAAKPELTEWMTGIVNGAAAARMYEDRSITDEEE